MRKLLILFPVLLLLAQAPGPRQTKAAKPQAPKSAPAKSPPCLQIRSIQETSIPASEGGGALVVIDTGAGLIGPFLKLPSLPSGVGYAGTEVALPSWPGEPCGRGNWSRDDDYLYMCLSRTTGGAVWRRIAWDRRWDSIPPPSRRAP